MTEQKKSYLIRHRKEDGLIYGDTVFASSREHAEDKIKGLDDASVDNWHDSDREAE